MIAALFVVFVFEPALAVVEAVEGVVAAIRRHGRKGGAK